MSWKNVDYYNRQHSRSQGAKWGQYVTCPCGNWKYLNKAGPKCKPCGLPWGHYDQHPWQSGPEAPAATAQQGKPPKDWDEVDPEVLQLFGASAVAATKLGLAMGLPKALVSKALASLPGAVQEPLSKDKLQAIMGEAKGRTTKAKKKLEEATRKHSEAEVALQQLAAKKREAESEHQAATEEAKKAEADFIKAAAPAGTAPDEAAKEGDDHNKDNRGQQEAAAAHSMEVDVEDLRDAEVKAEVDKLAKRQAEMAEDQDRFRELVVNKRQRRKTLLGQQPAQVAGGGPGGGSPSAPPQG